jgi:hypothetical protein
MQYIAKHYRLTFLAGAGETVGTQLRWFTSCSHFYKNLIFKIWSGLIHFGIGMRDGRSRIFYRKL